MTKDPLDEARQQMAKIRAHLETAQAALDMSDSAADPNHAQAKARALKMLQEAADSADVLAVALGGVPAPVRH